MMTSSSDILDCVGFMRDGVFSLLHEAGISINSATQPSAATTHENWSDWKRRLSLSPYLTDREAAAALANVDIFAPGYLSDEERAEIDQWQETLSRSILHSAGLCAEETQWDSSGAPTGWEIKPDDFAAWCAAKGILYPLPGISSTPITDEGLRDALTASEKERAEWKAKAIALADVRDRTANLQAEIDQLRWRLKVTVDEAAKVAAERDQLKADALNGKTKSMLLKIIGGLAITGHGMSIHDERLNGIATMVNDLQGAGVDVTEKTLRERIKEAANLIDRLK